MTYKLNDFCKLIGLTAVVLLPATAVMAENLIRNHSFDENTDAWWGTDNVVPALVDGQLCVDVPANTNNPWDVIVGINDMGLVKGEKYGFKFEAKGTPGGNIRALVQMPTDPWTAYATVTKPAVPEGDDYSANFKSIVDMKDAQIVFQIGGSKTAWEFCLDNVELNSGADITQYKAETATNVRVNQLGYLPDGPKRANLVLDKFAPQKWSLVDAAGGEVATGFSKNMGVDPSAGDEKIHLIDFSDVSVTGDDFKIVVRNKKGDDWVSDPFAIRADLYKDLLGDALSYFYPVRSGIEVDGALAGAKYARPAGHLGIAPNTGDTAVGCQTTEFSQGIYGEGWTCDYKLDVTGGWYDAGDHGKYVVNGGISVAQLLAAFEMTGDGKYRDGALSTMDYILGRNALNNSYVTGYGSHYSENQHSRWFSAQLNADLPHPPKGSLSGGPNSSIQDPVVQNLFGDAGCPGQTCYIDDIESWSTNEITINWNAALVQMAAFLKDQ